MYGSIQGSGTSGAKLFSIFQVKAIHDTVKKAEDLLSETISLHHGNILRVFNSIAAGKELLTLDIDLETDPESWQTYQKGMDHGLWESLFHARLPVKLTRADGSIIDGNLYSYTETGMEGSMARCVLDFKRNGYGSTFYLETGDKVTIYSNVTDGNIEWQGRLRIEETPAPSGRIITQISFEQTEYGQLIDVKTQDIAEIYGKTYQVPPAAQLDDWALYRLPAQLVR